MNITTTRILSINHAKSNNISSQLAMRAVKNMLNVVVRWKTHS